MEPPARPTLLGSQPGEILVVEDSVAVLHLLVALLDEAGYAVRRATTGAEALAEVAAREPDLVLMDVGLPDLDGYDVARRLGASPETREIPVVFISARDDEASRVKGFEAGGVDYITKPIHRAELYARIRTHVALRRTHRDVKRRNQELWQAREDLERELALRQEVEQSLRKSEEKFYRAFRSSPVIVALADLEDMRLLEVNDTFVRVTGHARADALGRTPVELGLWEDASLLASLASRLMDRGAVRDLECLYRVKGGAVRVGLFSAERIDIEGRPGALAVVADITARKQAENELRGSEAKLRAIWDHVHAGVLVLGPDMRILAMNRQMREWHPGLGIDEHPRCWEVLHQPPVDGPCEGCPSAETLADGRVHEAVRRAQTPRGPRDFRMVASPVADADGKVTAAIEVVEDVTARVQAEEEDRRLAERMVHLQRLESVGALAGGVAHEINNPLAVILNYAELLGSSGPGAVSPADCAGQITLHAERIAAVVRNLLAFAQQERRPRRPTPVADLVKPALDLLGPALEHDAIRVEVDLPGDLPAPRCHRQQVQQVLVNLLTNARDALNERYPGADDGKILRVRAARLALAGRDAVRITVENLGAEIPPEVRARLFEPFFTTKPRGVGTGLGLSVSHGIVVEHHGALGVESEPGGATRFHVDLPVDSPLQGGGPAGGDEVEEA